MLGFKALEWELFPSNLSGLCLQWEAVVPARRWEGGERAEWEHVDACLRLRRATVLPSGKWNKQSTSHDTCPSGWMRRCSAAVGVDSDGRCCFMDCRQFFVSSPKCCFRAGVWVCSSDLVHWSHLLLPVAHWKLRLDVQHSKGHLSQFKSSPGHFWCLYKPKQQKHSS